MTWCRPPRGSCSCTAPWGCHRRPSRTCRWWSARTAAAWPSATAIRAWPVSVPRARRPSACSGCWHGRAAGSTASSRWPCGNCCRGSGWRRSRARRSCCRRSWCAGLADLSCSPRRGGRRRSGLTAVRVGRIIGPVWAGKGRKGETPVLVPYTVDVPMARLPLANWILIAVTSVISLALIFGAWRGEPEPPDPPKGIDKDIPDHWLVIARDAREVVPPLALRPGAFSFGQLFTHLFVHANVWHLLANMLFLFCFGNAVNAKLGHAPYLLSYFLIGALAGAGWL